MKLAMLMYTVLAFAVLSVALYYTLTSSTKILFQTPCAILFYVDNPQSVLTTTYTFVPTVGRVYEAKDLAAEMTRGGASILPFFRVEFTDHRFVISCSVALRITDREYTPGAEAIVNGTYIGARYGEATRFLNHMLIQCAPSYPQYDLTSGRAFTTLYSTKSLQNARIGYDPIPAAPTTVSLATDATNPQLLIVMWNKPPPFVTTGVYLADSGAIDTLMVNWDQVASTPTFYKYTDLIVGRSFRAGVTFIGRYDESTILQSSSTGVTLQGIVSGTFTLDILAGTTTITGTNTPNPNHNNTASPIGQGVVDLRPTIYVPPNTHVKIVNNSAVRWPQDLISYTQIKSVTIRFYASISTSLPSDARITFGIDGPMFYYMYWRVIGKDAQDQGPEYYAFASTNATVGTTGAISPPLAYTDLTITSPAALESLFSNFGVGPQDVYLFYGYRSTGITYNRVGSGWAAPKIVTTLSLVYTT